MVVKICNLGFVCTECRKGCNKCHQCYSYKRCATNRPFDCDDCPENTKPKNERNNIEKQFANFGEECKNIVNKMAKNMLNIMYKR